MEFCGTSYNSIWWTYTSRMCTSSCTYAQSTVMTVLLMFQKNIRPHESVTHAPRLIMTPQANLMDVCDHGKKKDGDSETN